MKDIKTESVFTYKGYEGIVLAYSDGHRCGYVEIPKGSMLFGKNYTDKLPLPKNFLEGKEVGKRGTISTFLYACSNDDGIDMTMAFDVHGSITYSSSNLLDLKDSWFIGFDCHHAGDKMDESIMDEMNKEFQSKYPISYNSGVVRTKEYVISEIMSLIDQIIEIERLYNPFNDKEHNELLTEKLRTESNQE